MRFHEILIEIVNDFNVNIFCHYTAIPTFKSKLGQC